MPYKKKEKISLMLYYDYLEQFECLTDEQLRKLIYAMIEFDKNEKEIELDKITKMAFIPIKKRLKLDKKKWVETCQTNSKNAKIRWDKENATVCDGMPKDAKYADIEKDIDIEKEIERERESNNISHPNTPTEIFNYCSLVFADCVSGDLEKSCQKMFNHYEANNWKNIYNWKKKAEEWVQDDIDTGKIKPKEKEKIDTRKIREDENGKYYQLNSDGTRYYI